MMVMPVPMAVFVTIPVPGAFRVAMAVPVIVGPMKTYGMKNMDAKRLQGVEV